MVLEEGDPILTVLEDGPGDLQPEFAPTHRHHFHALVGSGDERCHADLGDRGDRRQSGLQGQIEVPLEDFPQFPRHLEPQGIDPDVGGLLLLQPGLDLGRKDLDLPQHAGDGVFRLGELLHERLRQLRADLGIPLLGLEDQLIQARVRMFGLGLEVGPTGLQVAVVRVEQAPGRFTLGIGLDEPWESLGGILECLGDPIGFKEHLGDGGEECPVSLEGGGDLRPEAGLAGGSQVEQFGSGTVLKALLDVPEQSTLQAIKRLDLGDRARVEVDLTQ